VTSGGPREKARSSLYGPSNASYRSATEFRILGLLEVVDDEG
jgi:hypothetical protein